VSSTIDWSEKEDSQDFTEEIKEAEEEQEQDKLDDVLKSKLLGSIKATVQMQDRIIKNVREHQSVFETRLDLIQDCFDMMVDTLRRKGILRCNLGDRPDSRRWADSSENEEEDQINKRLRSFW